MALETFEQYGARLRELRRLRQATKEEVRGVGAKRRSLTQDERKQIAAKTGSRCHICGGPLEPRWHADHVLAHSGGGRHSVDNYLPAHATCNNYRWDYSSTEFAEILKLGVFFRTAIEKGDAHADKLARSYLAKERQRQRRMR